MPTNNDDHTGLAVARQTVGTHGQAALLLVESLIHGLCEKSLLSGDEALAVVDRAIAVEFDRAVAADGVGALMWRAHALLSSIAASLRADERGQAASLRLVV